MTHQTKKIVLAFVTVVVAVGLLLLNPSILNSQAQMYTNEYGYDSNHNNYYPEPKKSSDTDIQKIKCVNSNINVNGIDITHIPQDDTAVTAANEGGTAAAEAANTQNGNGFADRITFERNLLNICANVNDNEQSKEEQGLQPTTTTLRVTEEVICQDHTGSTSNLCAQVNGPSGLITEDQYNKEVIANNPVPSEFPGSEAGTVVTLDPGDYRVFDRITQSVFDDIVTLNNANPGFVFLVANLNQNASGDCDINGEGTITAGESQNCHFVNTIMINIDD